MTCLVDTPLSTLIFHQCDAKSRSDLIALAPLETFARLIDSLRFSDLNEAGLLLDRVARE
jgi:hypothetical protein